MGDTGRIISLPLRIYYTKSASPQYILARSNKKFPVSLIPRQQTPAFHYASTLPVQEAPSPVQSEESSCIYATASLKACLDTICCASPEIVQDTSRDYSVYVLDPIESQSTPAPVNIPSDSLSPENRGSSKNSTPTTEQPLVAVGLGLMSWALLVEECDSVPVTGTVLRLGSGQEVLQVIFALREALPIQKAALPDALRSWGLPPPPPKRSQVHASRSHHHSKYPSSSNSRNSHSGHRQVGQNTNVAYFDKHASSTSTSHPTQSERILDSSAVYVGPPRRKVGRPAGADTQSKSNKSRKSSAGTSLGDTSNANRSNDVIDATKASDSSQDTNIPTTEPSLLQILANLSSSDQNAAILSALSAIDCQDQGTPNPALVDALKQLLSVAAVPEPPPAPSTPPQSLLHKKERSPADDDIVILDKENVNPTAFRRRANKEDEIFCSDIPDTNRPTPLGNKENSSPSTTTPALRKRRLSDFMDEQDREHAGKNKARSRADSITQPHVWSDSVSASLMHSSTSHNHNTPFGRSAPISRPGPSDENSVQFANGPATSPVRQPKRRAVPEWARTTTATQPRLSKEAEEHQKEKVPETKRKKTKATRKEGKVERRNVSRGASNVGHSTVRPKEALEAPTGGRASGVQPRSGQSCAVPPKPVMANSSSQLPIFASDLSLPPSSPPPPSPGPSSPTLSHELPQTPTRNDGPRSPSVYKDSSDIGSLFTPTPKSWMSDPNRHLSELLSGNSPLCSPGFVSTFGKVWPVLTGNRDGRGDGGEDKFGEELDEDLEFPPSSLPIASSDIDIEPPRDDHEKPDSASTQDSITQHWAGLPPSSPPPPTSPPLIAQDVFSDVLDLDDLPSISATTPDADPFPRSHPSDPEESQQGAHEMSFDEMSCLFSDPGNSDLQLEDVFAHFPDTQDQNGSSQEGMEVVSSDIVQNGLVDFDFTEFWQSVKPLLDHHEDGRLSDASPSSYRDDSPSQMGETDHSKLAAEVQALFSGCLM